MKIKTYIAIFLSLAFLGTFLVCANGEYIRDIDCSIDEELCSSKSFELSFKESKTGKTEYSEDAFLSDTTTESGDSFVLNNSSDDFEAYRDIVAFAEQKDFEMSGDAVIYNPSSDFEMSGDAVIYNPSSDFEMSGDVVIYNPNGKPFKTMEELYQYWEKNEYPDYVCGIWSTNGGTEEITIGIIKDFYLDGNRAEDIIYSNIEEDNKVTIVYQDYSKNQLLSIMDEMNGYMSVNGEELGIISSGIYDDRNVVEVHIKEEKINDEKTGKLVQYLKLKYNDAICIKYTNEKITYTDMLIGSDATISNKEKINGKIIVASVILVSILILSSTVVFYRKQVFKTVTGEEIEKSVYTTRKLKKEIKNTPISPSENLDMKIREMSQNNR